MPEIKACIYCSNSATKFCKAHVVPQSLGSFQDQPRLLNKVCTDCDSSIGQFEDQFTHCGIAAFMRPRIGIKGRSSFRRPHVGQKPIEVKAVDPITNYEILIEPTENIQPPNGPPQAKALPQIVVEDADGKTGIVPLFADDELKGLSSGLLKDEINKTGLSGRLKITPFGLTNEQEEYVFSLLKIEETEIIGEHGEPQIIPAKSRAKVTCDERYFQAVAKIAFHYYLISEGCLHSGYEPQFGQIRSFIRYGKGDVGKFIQERRGFLTRDTKLGLRPKYYGHIIVASVNMKAIYIKLKFFIGPDCDPPYYNVLLCRNPFSIVLEPYTFGHGYIYFEPSERKGYDGIMQKLGVANKIILPPGF